MTDEILLEAEDKMQKAIEVMENRFLNVRAGRANPRILDKVMPEYYGTPTPLIQLANISVPEARKIVIKPFDRNSIGAIEKAIFEADLGLTPNNNGETVMLIIPELTEERRKEYVKEAKTIAEEGKVALRNIRQEANSSIKKIEELPEDEGKRAQDEVQDLINKYNILYAKNKINTIYSFALKNSFILKALILSMFIKTIINIS